MSQENNDNVDVDPVSKPITKPKATTKPKACLLYTSPRTRDRG